MWEAGFDAGLFQTVSLPICVSVVVRFIQLLCSMSKVDLGRTNLAFAVWFFQLLHSMSKVGLGKNPIGHCSFVSLL
jgi:hypothetical protein